jgi:methionyl-tRNA synthetase
MLMALGIELPKQVFGHPWLLIGDGKMSKSKGNVIYADDLRSYFGTDAVRYIMLHEMPFAQDGSVTYELIIERINSDLVNTLGNLVNRTISMTNKYFNGLVQKGGVEEEVDRDQKQLVKETPARVEASMDGLHVQDAIDHIFTLIKRCNKYIDETEPWVLAKDEAKADRLSTVLYNLIEGICIGTTLLAPFLPETADRIMKQLNTSLRDFDELNTFGLYPNGNKVTDAPEILFARLDKEEILKKAAEIQSRQREEFLAHQEKARENLVKAGKMTPEEAAAAKAALEGTPAEVSAEEEMQVENKEVITYDDFAKCQFCVGEILECKEVPKSKKLLCSQVKIGNQTRQILSGIKQFYSPEQMVGKKVMVLMNLPEREMAGLKSEGMLLCAEDQDGNLALVTPEKEMPSGAEIC